MVTVLFKKAIFKASNDRRLCNINRYSFFFEQCEMISRLWPSPGKYSSSIKFTSFKWIEHWTIYMYVVRTMNIEPNKWDVKRSIKSKCHLLLSKYQISNQMKRNFGTTLSYWRFFIAILHWTFKAFALAGRSFIHLPNIPLILMFRNKFSFYWLNVLNYE